MYNMVIVQLIGAIAYILLSRSYFKKERREILFMQIFAYVFFTIHYYLLNGITGAICNVVGLASLISLFIFDKGKKMYKIICCIFFVTFLIVINIITFQNIFSIFPMIASVIAIASFLNKKENFIRRVGVVATLCWLIYAIYYKSYISIIFEVFTLINVCVALLKNTKKSMKKVELDKK